VVIPLTALWGTTSDSDAREPLLVVEEGSHNDNFWSVERKACCGVLDALQRFDCGGRESSQESVAVVEASDDPCCFSCEERPDSAYVVESNPTKSGFYPPPCD